MKKFFLILILIMISVVVYLTIVNNTTTRNLVSPVMENPPFVFKNADKIIEGVENSSPKAPKTFKFDRSTDLNAELNKVNPEVLESDFVE